MKIFKILIVLTGLMPLALGLTAPACSAAESGSALIKIYTSAETAEFTSLAKETLAALAAGKSSEVVTKLTDLETAWDDKEKILRPKDDGTWTLIDKTLDKAISALRSSRKDLKKGQTALEDFLMRLDQTTKNEPNDIKK